MFDCGGGYKSQSVNGHREKFVRFGDLDSSLSSSSDAGVKTCGFSIDKLSHGGRGSSTPSRSFKRGMKKGSEGLKSIGRSLGFGVSKAVFPEDLKVSEKKIFDPQDKFLLLWNKLFVISCILSVSVDPLFFYLPVINDSLLCLGIDRKLAIIVTTLRTVIDAFYLIHMALQFRTAYIAPSSRVFGRGELVIDPAQIAKRYLQRYFIIDFLSVLPLPQIVVWRFLQRSKGSDVLATKQALLFLILLQYIPRFLRMVPLSSELKRTAGVFAETAWAGAANYLLLFMLASHIVGSFWYLLAVERNDFCWQKACSDDGYNKKFLYCGNQYMEGYSAWQNRSKAILTSQCSADDDNPPFDYGIFQQALSSGIVSSKKFFSKYCYCLWWGLQNLSTLGQGLQTSTYTGEIIFSIALAIAGLILFALLIGNMQTYLQSLTIRLEEMRIKRRDSEQWMHHRLLPQELRERVSSDVLYQRGSYGEAFSRHDEMFKDDKEKVQKWRDALHQAAYLSASYHFKHGDGDEREFIERIVKVVSSRINRLPLHVADYPVGLESRLQEVCSFLDVGSDHRVLTVGIWGMGGIGKTTLARAVSNLVGDHFEGLSYLDNVREVSSKHGLVHLQKKLLLDMLGKKDFLFESVYEGASVIKTMIHRKKVLLIVDDVDSIEQLRALVGGPEWFGSGSRVIITTRDKHLLVHQGADKIYEARELNFTESLELLRWNAFRYGNVDPSYTEVLNQVVAYASGHPLALEVIGSNMFKKSVAEWTSALNRLKRIPHKGIQSMLKVSYDYLGEDEKRVFLDIACCFKGYDLTEVEDILRAHHGYNMKHHIGVLIEKSLLSVSSDGKVTLHPLLEDMGKEIVRQESPAEPGRRSRLWFSEDIVQVLEENMGTSSIEIIHLDFPFMQEVEWDGKAFKKMKKLKTLIIKKCHFSKAPIHLPNSLRVLEWWRYPSEELPSDFHAKKLAILKPAKLLKESGRTLPKVPEVPRDYLRVSPLTLRILQRVFLGEKAWRPFDLLQALPSFLEVLQTSQRVPQLTLHTWLFQTKTVWRHFVLLHALESVPVILQTSQVVPNVNLQTSQRIFQVETVCTHVGLQTSVSIPGVIPTFVMVPEVMLQTSMRAEMVWRLVGLASTVVGLFCHALSPSLKRLIGGWNFFKLFLYCVLSFVVCVTILFAKQFSLLRKPGQLKNYVIFAVLMIMSVYSFLYDKAVDGKPEIKSLVSNAAFALVSLSLSKLVKSGYEIGIFAYFLTCFTIQLVTINWALILVAIIFGCPLFVMHSSSHSTQNDGDGGHVIPFSLDSRPNVGRGGQHHVVDMPREERELQQRTNSLRSSVAL